MTVLFADDEINILNLYKSYIEKYESPYTVGVYVDSHKKLVDKFRETNPDVIFTDIFPPHVRNTPEWENLEIKDGLEAIQLIKSETERPINYVVVTRSTEFEYAKKAVNLGVNDFLAKPLSYELFRGVLIKTEEKRFMEISLSEAWSINDEKQALDLCSNISQMALSFYSHDLLNFSSSFKKWKEMEIPVNQMFFLKHFGSLELEFSKQLEFIEGRLKELFAVTKNIQTSESIIKYVNDNIFFSGLCLDMVAERFGYSVSYLSVYFKDEVGKGFTEYVSDGRIKKAKELLLSSNKTVKEIASECGFAYSNYFIRVFSQKEGMTPVEWRNLNTIIKDK